MPQICCYTMRAITQSRTFVTTYAHSESENRMVMHLDSVWLVRIFRFFRCFLRRVRFAIFHLVDNSVGIRYVSFFLHLLFMS